MRRAWVGTLKSRLEPIQELGMREHAGERVLDALLEAAARGALVVELHEPRQVVGVERAAKCLPRQRRDDSFGARLFGLRDLRPADENLVAARRARESSDV